MQQRMPHVEIRGKKLHFVEQGAGFPVVLGPSYLWDASMWRPQVEHLAKRYRCLVPELWGHGSCDAIPEIPYTLAQLAQDMRGFVDSLGLDSFAIVGLSVGGMWGTQLALDCPERVKALVLMDSFVGPEPAVTQARYFGMLDAILRAKALPPPLVEQIVPLFFAPETLADNPALVDRFRQSLLDIAPDRVPSIVALGRAIFSRPSLLGRLGEIRCPTLVAVGRQDRARPVHEAQVMAKAIAEARFEVIEGAGHISALEQPDRVLAMLEHFLGQALG